MLKNNQPQETKAPESKDSKENQRLVADLNKLRSRAEKLMTPDGRQDIALMSTDGIAKLIYELDTHKIELEMQNLELHRAQDELIEVHTQYTELYDLAPIGYFTIDENGLILQANQTISSMLNVVDNQLKMQLLHNFIYPQDQDIYYFYRRNVLATTETLSCELRLRTNSRGFFWVRMDSTRVENKNGNISIRSVLSDITQSKLAEQEVLRVNNELESRVEERTRQLQQEIEERKLIEADLRKVSRAVDFSSSAIFITDANHKIEIVNPKFTEITGFTKAEAIGKEPRELLLGKTSAGAYTQMQDTIASGEEWKGELYNRKKDGSYYRARISISAVKDS
ncbi:MAG: PAS domain S-box-containing protein, partial [Gammaproteobacteria bacterium]